MTDVRNKIIIQNAMRKLLAKLLKTISLFLLILGSQKVNAQDSFFNFTITNDHQTSDRILEFDLYLLDTDAGATFELGTVQAGITVNPGIYNGGTITMEIVPGSSELMSWQQPNTAPSVLWSQSSNAIKLTSRTPIGSGTILSQTAPGTRVCRLRMTNSVAFTTNSTANLTFNFAVTPYPTKVSQYILGVNTPLTCDATNCFSNAANILLNPPPAAFNVTGGGSYCQGSGGVPVGLEDSENGVTYTLFKDGTSQVPEVIGTGVAITFGDQLFGTYTISGTNAGGTTPMTGNVIIVEIPTPGAPIADVITQPTCELATGSVVLIGLPATGTWTITRTPGGTTNTGTGTYTTITELESGSYTFTVTGASGCTSLPSGIVVINTQPVTPPKPLITSIDNYLESSSASGNQWYNSSGKIIGETGQMYTPSSNGNYYVVVTNADGCISEASNTISFTTEIEKTGIFKGISVYPIPAADYLIIENNTFSNSIDFEIVNSFGMKIYTSILNNNSIVDLSRFSPGFYYIRFTKEGFYYVYKFIKQ
jgi:hypothetical protein